METAMRPRSCSRKHCAMMLPGFLLTGIFLLHGTPAIQITAAEAAKVTKVTQVTKNQAAAPVINTSSLPDGTVGIAYRQTLDASGSAPIGWTVSSGGLPDGLRLQPASGVISGTPAAAGAFNFTLKAANTAGDAAKDLTILISFGGSATVVPPEGEERTLPGGSNASLPGGTVIDADGTITLPSDKTGTLTTPIGMVIQLPGASVILLDAVVLPPASKAAVTTRNGTRIEVPGSTRIQSDGTITPPPGGTSTVMTSAGNVRAGISGGMKVGSDGRIAPVPGAAKTAVTVSGGTKILFSNGRIFGSGTSPVRPQCLFISVGQGGAEIVYANASAAAVSSGSAIRVNSDGSVRIGTLAELNPDLDSQTPRKGGGCNTGAAGIGGFFGFFSAAAALLLSLRKRGKR